MCWPVILHHTTMDSSLIPTTETLWIVFFVRVVLDWLSEIKADCRIGNRLQRSQAYLYVLRASAETLNVLTL